MHDSLIVVEGLVSTERDDTDLSTFGEAMGYALDQRAFGPRRLVVAFTEADGRLRAIAHTRRTDPIEIAFRGCLQHLGSGAAAAVAFNDETVCDGPPADGLADRFWVWRTMAWTSGVRLVDWIACDDDRFRSTKLAIAPDEEWWDAP